MVRNYLFVFLVSMVPIIELRGAIPIGLGLGLPALPTYLVCVVAGAGIFLAGGGAFSEIPTIVGVGTIITAFFMGPLIEFFNVTVARPMLNGKQQA